MIHLKEENKFDELIKEPIVLVDFYATWCGPCQLLAPILEEVEKEIPDLEIVKIDVDELPNIARRFGIMSIPTLIVFKNGKQAKTSLGYISKDEIKKLLN